MYKGVNKGKMLMDPYHHWLHRRHFYTCFILHCIQNTNF